MHAVLFHGERNLEFATVADPVAGPTDVVIRVSASGMCGSDLHTYRGPALPQPVIAGHEPAGEVVSVGSAVSRSWQGQPVMVHHYFGCGMCDQCRTGWTQLCRSGSRAMGATAPGAHADFVRVPVSCVMRTPDGLSHLAAAAISCGTGTAWSALHRMNVRGEDSIAIFGQGPVGLAATQLAVAMGAKVIALDTAPARRDQAVRLGAVAAVDPAQVTSVADAVRDLNGGRGVTKSLDTSGASSAAVAALDVLDVWGTACWVGVGGHVEFDVTDLLYRQITAMTSWTMSIPAMTACAQFVVDRSVDVDQLFTDRWSLDEAQAAYQLFDLQNSGKGVFVAADVLGDRQ